MLTSFVASDIVSCTVIVVLPNMKLMCVGGLDGTVLVLFVSIMRLLSYVYLERRRILKMYRPT